MINRFSSRRHPIYESFLAQRLKNAKSYDRIAGYFSSSILQIAGEELETIKGKIRVICNSDLDSRDIDIARQAANVAKAVDSSIKREWCEFHPEKLVDAKGDRFKRLYQFLKEGRLEVRVLPSDKFGLIHGKAGVIELADGSKTSFMGSVNETFMGWKVNYEILWEDPSADAVKWVQDEFEMFWNSPYAVPLSQFVIEDIGRISHREVLFDLEEWKKKSNPAEVVVESPIYRKELGLAPHQKFFINSVFEDHKSLGGARYILADGVGLGKTAQLGMAAQLMALHGSLPVLVIAPKTLVKQWQGELKNLLDVPSAIWNGRYWVDENELEYPPEGPIGITKCPRRIGIISQGLITNSSESSTQAKQFLLNMKYECVIVDEAHRARRKNLGVDKEQERAEPNNLLRFLNEIAARTKSLLLGTATPVQMYPVEAYDLLNALSVNNDHVLGNDFSYWHKPAVSLPVVMGRASSPNEPNERWEWLRNPLPPASEDLMFKKLRRTLGMQNTQAVADGDSWNKLGNGDKQSIRQLSADFLRAHNPYLRHIIRRTREYLEGQIDPQTSEPMLKKVEVELRGEDAPIILPPYLLEAYHTAEEFCNSIARRSRAAGFLKTLLLRRLGSSIESGRLTAQKMLTDWVGIGLEEDDETEYRPDDLSEIKQLTPEEIQLLQKFVDELNSSADSDPKFEIVRDLLINQKWLEQGCIIFSQYFDTARWLGEQLIKILPSDVPVGLYAGGDKSGIWYEGQFKRTSRDEIKEKVFKHQLKLLIGTDAASEGLNLQKLGTLINLDLPWNPTRLEQRKGRIQRIGQIREKVFVYNMRYKDSVEDRVHQLLSQRLQNVRDLFGQIPDVLEDAWIEVALGNIEEAKNIIGGVPEQHPFELKYQKPQPVDWESCATVLDSKTRLDRLRANWV